MDDFLTEIPDIPIEGEYVTLRLLRCPDAPALYAVIDDSRDFLARHLPWPAECTSVEDVESRIDTWELQADMANGACWGIFAKGAGSSAPARDQQPASDQQLAGVIILGWIQAAHLSASISYWLGEKFTGRGLATEALKLVSRFAFTELGLNRLEISAAQSNTPSIALARRCGFREEGFSREFERINGKFVDHVRLARLASDPEN